MTINDHLMMTINCLSGHFSEMKSGIEMPTCTASSVINGLGPGLEFCT